MADQRRIIVMGLILGTCLFAATPTFQAHEGHEWPCREDAEKFCKDVKPGEGRIIKCLKEHESELSGECKEQGAAVKSRIKEKMGEMQEACGADKEKFCKDVKPGEGRIIQCLKQHKDALSPSCKKFGEETAEKREKMEEKREQWKEKRGRMRERMEESKEIRERKEKDREDHDEDRDEERHGEGEGH